jgi:hypothetical protein
MTRAELQTATGATDPTDPSGGTCGPQCRGTTTKPTGNSKARHFDIELSLPSRIHVVAPRLRMNGASAHLSESGTDVGAAPSSDRVDLGIGHRQ